VADAVPVATDLLQHLIRNACVNDGTAESGQEIRSADVLHAYLEGPGLDLERYEPSPGRASLVARMAGSDPGAPSLMLMAHTDVVPVNPDGWSREPFGGELVDGWVWGRGAIDMLCETATMAVAVRRLADEGFRPRGDLVYLAVADEESMGVHGAHWLVDHARDAVAVDFALTESGGAQLQVTPDAAPVLPVMVGEKGSYWCTIRVHGAPSHASMPYRTDNALIKAAEVIRRLGELRPEAQVHDVWRRFVLGAGFPDEVADLLLDPSGVDAACEAIASDDLSLARAAHAATHTTFAPTVARGGVKTNIIPDRVEVQVDVRTLPGQRGEEVRAMIEEAIGPDLLQSTEIVTDSDDPSTASPVDTPLYDALRRTSERLVPGASTVPSLFFGATDARFLRRLGTTAYGAGLFSDRIPVGTFSQMFHGDDERVDVASLGLQAALWDGVVRELLG
jgi:acetylornithine deacetylase/succinyl-diaminopimelate desuccinylase-like protein